MEELLASIRKAINEDIGEAGSVRPQAALVKGSMRESRVRMGEEPATPANEIQELRNKITRNRGAETVQRPLAPAPPPPPASRPMPGFAGILGGDHDRLKRPAETPPAPLRPSYAESEFRALEHRPEPPRPFRETEAEPRRAAEPTHGEQPMISGEAAAAASAAFNRLADSILSRATSERSIEEITRELLRSMLKQWLDENLPPLVERLVREEIERVARRGR
jgi:hypothetical protein